MNGNNDFSGGKEETFADNAETFDEKTDGQEQRKLIEEPERPPGAFTDDELVTMKHCLGQIQHVLSFFDARAGVTKTVDPHSCALIYQGMQLARAAEPPVRIEVRGHSE